MSNSHSQIIINSFKGRLTINSELKNIQIMPDESILILDTNDGIYYLISLDYFSEFEYIKQILQAHVGEYSKFIETVNPVSSFGDLAASRFYTSKDSFPPDFEKFKNYVISDKSIFFRFLVKK